MRDDAEWVRTYREAGLQYNRALVVHSNQGLAAALAEDLRELGVPADRAHGARGALSMLANTRYGAIVLEDELPGSGSLQVLQMLDAVVGQRPPVLLICVPRSILAEARAFATDPGLEYVANPETEAEVGRLALRTRARLVNAGLAGGLDGPDARAAQTTDDAADGATGGDAPGGPNRAVLAVALLVLAVVLVVLLLQQLGGRALRSGPAAASVMMVPRTAAPATGDTRNDPNPDRRSAAGVAASGRRVADPEQT